MQSQSLETGTLLWSRACPWDVVLGGGSSPAGPAGTETKLSPNFLLLSWAGVRASLARRLREVAALHRATSPTQGHQPVPGPPAQSRQSQSQRLLALCTSTSTAKH